MQTSIRSHVCGRAAWLLCFASAIVVFCTLCSATCAAQGMLQTIRDDVRGGSAPSTSAPSDNTPNNNSDECYKPNAWLDAQNAGGCEANQPAANSGSGTPSALCIFPAIGAAILSPLWVPHAMLGDDFIDNTPTSDVRDFWARSTGADL